MHFDLLPDKVKVFHTDFDLKYDKTTKEVLDLKNRLGEVSFMDEVIRISIQKGLIRLIPLSMSYFTS